MDKDEPLFQVEKVKKALRSLEPSRVYLSVSFHEVTLEEADAIVAAAVEVRGSRVGMTVTYDDPIVGEED
jgi:hypothetical protein